MGWMPVPGLHRHAGSVGRTDEQIGSIACDWAVKTSKKSAVKIEQKQYSIKSGWEILRKGTVGTKPYDLVLAFGSPGLLSDSAIYVSIKNDYPSADVLLCSTAGEIADIRVNDDSVSLVALQLERTRIRTAAVCMDGTKDSFQAAHELAGQLPVTDLKSVLLISDGLQVNGSDLMLALQEVLPEGIIITGGMAGDSARFTASLVGLNEMPVPGNIAAIGFYGNRLRVTFGSAGGWDSFGVERLITRSEKNILFELDRQPALDIYKRYLGEYADELPGSGLLFPLSIKTPESDYPLVRTILSVNEQDKSVTFAGNMPEGAYAQLMKANFDRLIDGAADAAQNSLKDGLKEPDLAILISCVGRKLVLHHRIEEEIEIIRSIYGEKTVLTGFYSYGEFSPVTDLGKCELHNQTMTITTITEE